MMDHLRLTMKNHEIFGQTNRMGVDIVGVLIQGGTAKTAFKNADRLQDESRPKLLKDGGRGQEDRKSEGLEARRCDLDVIDAYGWLFF